MDLIHPSFLFFIHNMYLKVLENVLWMVAIHIETFMKVALGEKTL
jgi:hypothetical protein